MALDPRHTLVTQGIPNDLAALFIERQHPPFVGFIFLDRLDVAVEPNLELSLARFNSRGEVNAIVPNNRARVGQARHCGLPADILTRPRVPLRGQRRRVVHPKGRRSTELRPVGRLDRGGEPTGQKSNCDDPLTKDKERILTLAPARHWQMRWDHEPRLFAANAGVDTTTGRFMEWSSVEIR
jgi:hypothetical protein